MKPVSGDLPALDFASARRRLGQLARSAFPEWTDHTMAGFGNTLLDLMAFVSDTLSYYAECQGRECRLTTATQRENVVALARMLGYKAHGATAARAKVVFRLRKPHDTDIVIPTGMLVSTEKITSPKRYQLREDVRIAAGATSATGEAEASTGQLQVVDLRGLPDQAVTLMFAPYLEGSLVVTDSDGAVFHEVDTFIDSKGADRHYVVTVAAQGRATLRFGNGVLGAAPVGRIDIRYKTGGGVADLVEADALTVLERPVLDARGRPVPMTVTNPAPSAGGADAESTASIVARAPQSLRVAQRSITREDFEINARRLPGVARALMLTSDDDQRIPENTGRMYVVPVTGGELTEELRAQVLHQVTQEYPCPLTFQVQVETALYLPIQIEAELELAPLVGAGGTPWLGTASRQDTIAQDIRDRLRRLFALTLADGSPNPDVDFGYYRRGASGRPGEVAWSDVVSAICATPGVRKVTRLTLNGAQQDIPLELAQFPTLGDVDLRVAGASHA